MMHCSTARVLSAPSSPSLRSQQASRSMRRPVQRRATMQPVRALFGNKEGGGGGNPFANMGNLMENVKKAQQMVAQETQRVQGELAEMEFEGYSEDETVRVVYNGNQQPLSVDITEEAMAQGAEKLSEAVTDAIKEAHGKSTVGMKEKMKELASTLGLPGLPQQ